MDLIKVGLIIFNFLAILGYIPINHLIKSGRIPKIAFDERIPLIPLFVYPYIFLYIPWIVLLYLSYYFLPTIDLQRLTLTTAVASTLGYLSFIFFPTYVVCLYPSGTTFAHRLLQHVHFFDKQNNACPSMHVYMSVILMFFSWTSNLGVNLLILIAGSSIIAATVLIKRHYVVDIVGGLFVGILSTGLSYYVI